MKKERENFMSAKQGSRETFIFFINVLSAKWGKFFLSVVIVVIRALLLITPSLITKEIIDEIIPSQDSTKLVLFSTLLVLIPITTGILIVLDLKILRFIIDFCSKFRTDLYDGIQRQPLNKTSEMKMGDMLNRIHDETANVFMFLYQGIGNTVWLLVTIISGLGIMIYFDLELSLLFLFVLLIRIILIRIVGEKIKKAAKISQENRANSLENLREVINGLSYIKLRAAEEKELHKLNIKLEKYNSTHLKLILLNRTGNFIELFCASLITCIIYLYGGFKVIDGSLTVGTIIAFSSLLIYIQPAILGLQGTYFEWKQIIPSISRIKEILFTTYKSNENLIPQGNFDIQIQNVDFEYDNQKKILKNINLIIPSGDVIAILGKSGAGKSTLGDLILGLNKPSRGKILIGNLDVETISNDWLMRNVASISQDVQIREGTIYDNICYGLNYVDQTEILRTIKDSGIESWIKTLPDGIFTKIGEKGKEVSGGERQRISIARALIRKPLILIMDEATASLDNITSINVVNNIRKCLPKSTLIVITHQTEVAKLADRVVKIENGYLEVDKKYLNP